ncbi:hypothetical protein N7509_014216 [Penicillium cosmopolitanum]|uniref:Uncharacterized protein n=1 Tax=Penicillium cosmopolitanum TaxID=1131564 RepID=A0A9W9S2V0_9EURO|nr:uncharacterized protein N7509_014216 [Penicillium cosmopolitanum]KAJ5369604.1 hypothetical protein N7509_014216 [Penicillium cosmopolitanum]
MKLAKRPATNLGDFIVSIAASAQGNAALKMMMLTAGEKACGAQGLATSFKTFVTASEAAYSGTEYDANTILPNAKRDMAFEA